MISRHIVLKTIEEIEILRANHCASRATVMKASVLWLIDIVIICFNPSTKSIPTCHGYPHLANSKVIARASQQSDDICIYGGRPIKSLIVHFISLLSS